MKTHELKSWIEYFEPVFNEIKTFEIRKNDRDYKVGDRLMLKEYDPEYVGYTGRYCFRTITYILSENPFIELNDYVILSLIKGDQYKQ